MKKATALIAGLLVTLPILLIIEGVRENRQLDIEHVTLTSNKLSHQQSAVKIAHLSDLQFPRLRVDTTELLTTLEQENPDVVFLTGDTIDRTEQVPTTEFFDFLHELTSRFPTYVVNGNHEETNPNYMQWRKKIINSQAIYLENKTTQLTIGKESFNLVGLSNRTTSLPTHEQAKINPTFDTLLLAHHPELLDNYIKNLNHPFAIFSGHAHGGQWIIPGTHGLLAPDQGFLPTLTNGLYVKQHSHLIVSRGLANSTFPIRLNNYPHLIFATIKAN